jgi:hypothetical protein
LSHKYWPRDVKHVEGTMCSPNLQMAVDMSIQQSWFMFSRCYLRSDNCLFKECRVPKVTRSKVGDLILKLLIFEIAISIIFMYN